MAVAVILRVSCSDRFVQQIIIDWSGFEIRYVGRAVGVRWAINRGVVFAP